MKEKSTENKKYPKIRKPLKWLRKYKSFVIHRYPRSLEIKNLEDTYFERLDDLFITENLSSNAFVYLIIAFVFIGPAILFALSAPHMKEPRGIFIFAGILFSIGVFYIFSYYTLRKRTLTLDRMNGLIIYPGFMWSKPITIPFEQIAVATTAAGHGDGSTKYSIFHPNGFTRITLMITESGWNFYVWYMDKNRPLPEDTIFDPYRQKDYERRKAEGFPKPLYPSFIYTPENTPEQQKEREQYWKDELCMDYELKKKFYTK